MCQTCTAEEVSRDERIRRYDRDVEVRWNPRRHRYEVWKKVRRLGRSLFQFALPPGCGSLAALALFELERRDPTRIWSESPVERDRELAEMDGAGVRSGEQAFEDFHRSEGGPRLFNAFRDSGIFQEYAGRKKFDRKSFTVRMGK